MDTIDIKFKKLDPNAVIPSYAHEGDVGMDLTAIAMEYDEKNDVYIYHTGLAFESDFNIGQFLFPRSSNRKTDSYLCNHVGIADSATYRGEIMLCFKNRTSIEERMTNLSNDYFFNTLANELKSETEIKTALLMAYKQKSLIFQDEDVKRAIAIENAPYQVGDRIAQMVFFRYPTVKLSETQELSQTERGYGGFGSSGK